MRAEERRVLIPFLEWFNQYSGTDFVLGDGLEPPDAICTSPNSTGELWIEVKRLWISRHQEEIEFLAQFAMDLQRKLNGRVVGDFTVLNFGAPVKLRARERDSVLDQATSRIIDATLDMRIGDQRQINVLSGLDLYKASDEGSQVGVPFGLDVPREETWRYQARNLLSGANMGLQKVGNNLGIILIDRSSDPFPTDEWITDAAADILARDQKHFSYLFIIDSETIDFHRFRVSSRPKHWPRGIVLIESADRRPNQLAAGKEFIQSPAPQLIAGISPELNVFLVMLQRRPHKAPQPFLLREG
ncbi:MAG: hypothetical protein NTZ05_01140 [Chloroflexi bacterium]|nr:hypothetical protein [Chloroflexota bacterium]